MSFKTSREIAASPSSVFAGVRILPIDRLVETRRQELS